MHQTMLDYLAYREGVFSTRCPYKYKHYFRVFWKWADARGLDPIKAKPNDLLAYQRHMSDDHLTPKGEHLSAASQVRSLSAIKGYYRFLERRGLVLIDVAKKLKYPQVQRYVTKRDYFSLQEVTAILQTQAKRVVETPKTKLKWAIEMRMLAFLCLAVATGRRHSGLRDLKVGDLDFERDEIRVEYEKGRSGRVLPVAHWAMVVAKEYLEQARGRFVTAATSNMLFVSKKNGFITHQTDETLPILHQQTVEENPDLDELPNKVLTMHGLRVTFAKLLFNGGCNIRSVNELMLHELLSTTAYYTPLKLEELRTICRVAHPRA